MGIREKVTNTSSQNVLFLQGYTPLHIAAMHDREETIRMLVLDWGKLVIHPTEMGFHVNVIVAKKLKRETFN